MIETRKELGRIRSFKLGRGGYDDAMFGFSFSLGTAEWGVDDFWGAWIDNLDQPRALDSLKRITALMESAKVADSSELVGKPVEVTFYGMRMESWRILTEVL